MASASDDLEFNPFFRALQTRFSSQYERAQQNCWLVCIPVTASLESCTISKQFVEKHLLEPSVLFRDVYESRVSKLSWRLSGSTLHSINNSGDIEFSVKVLAEELAYNKALKQFKMFITDRPLDPSYKAPELYDGDVGGGSVKLKEVFERKRTYKEHRDFLQSFQNCREGLEELNRQIRSFKQNYMVVESERLLLDTATKLEGMVRQGNAAFLEANKQDARLQDRRVLDACWFSLEGYLMHHVHSKVYPAIRGVHAKFDKQLSERCRLLRGKLTPSAIGVSSEYECQYPSTLAHLGKIESLDTPLEILYVIQDAMDNIMADVKDNFLRSLRIGEPSPLASDDLISVVATILTKLDCKCLLSALYYVEHFHWVTDSDQLSYILVTFRAAVEFLRGREMEKWLPSNPPVSLLTQASPAYPKLIMDDVEMRHSISPHHSLSTSGSEESSSVGSGPISSLSQTIMAQIAEERKGHFDSHPQEPPSTDSNLGPFLSQLLENDHVITSSDYYGKYS